MLMFFQKEMYTYVEYHVGFLPPYLIHSFFFVA